MTNNNEKEKRAGVGVDSTGGSVIDPTANVIALNDAATKRQDDLREEFKQYVESQLKHVDEASRMRAEHITIIAQHEAKRLDHMRDAQLQHVEEMARLRADHTQDLLKAEASRINAIREVDVGSVATANERAQQQAVVLANQVATSAETLRALVATTNAAVATSMSNMSTQFSERISLLEKSSYMGKGKEEVSDPMLKRLYEEMRAMNEYSTSTTGKGAGMHQMWAVIVAAIATVGVVIMMAERFVR